MRPISRERTEGSRLEQLYRQHAEPAFRLALVLTGDPELAADLTHDAFIRVASRFGHLRDPAALPAYLRRTVTNLVIGQGRRRRAEQRILSGGGIAPSLDRVADFETRDELWRRVLALPPRQRAVIVLRFYEDLSERQAADVLGTSPRAVNALVSRGLQLLRAEPERSDDELGSDASG